MPWFECDFYTESDEDCSRDAVDDPDAAGIFEPFSGELCSEDENREPCHGEEAVHACQEYPMRRDEVPLGTNWGIVAM